jgi:hypothetical protein
MRPSLPGTVGTLAFFMVSRAVALSPIRRMLSDWNQSKRKSGTTRGRQERASGKRNQAVKTRC